MSEEKAKQNRNEILNELYAKLAAPFPEEALSTDSSRGFDLTSVKAQYVVERLNEVLGFANWRLEGEFDEADDGSVLYQGKLILFLGDFIDDPNANYHYVPTVGFAGKKKLKGDTYKSAKTDALSKAGSYIGIANDVFKGKVTPPSKKSTGKTFGSSFGAKTETKKPSGFQGKPAKKVSSF